MERISKDYKKGFVKGYYHGRRIACEELKDFWLDLYGCNPNLDITLRKRYEDGKD